MKCCGKRQHFIFCIKQLRLAAFSYVFNLHPSFDELLAKYRQVMRNELGVARQYEAAAKALEPYREYLD